MPSGERNLIPHLFKTNHFSNCHHDEALSVQKEDPNEYSCTNWLPLMSFAILCPVANTKTFQSQTFGPS